MVIIHQTLILVLHPPVLLILLIGWSHLKMSIKIVLFLSLFLVVFGTFLGNLHLFEHIINPKNQHLIYSLILFNQNLTVQTPNQLLVAQHIRMLSGILFVISILYLLYPLQSLLMFLICQKMANLYNEVCNQTIMSIQWSKSKSLSTHPVQSSSHASSSSIHPMHTHLMS